MASAGLNGREIQFAQQLASNKLKVRNKTLAKLQKFVGTIDEGSVTDEELLKLWKGLFYCMWMSDKVPVQQELAANIANILHHFPSPISSFQFLRCFYLTMNREWNGIDHLRQNKFYSLQRRVLEESLKIAVSDIFNKTTNNETKQEEDDEDEEEFMEKESDTVFSWSSTMCDCLQVDICPSVVLHFSDIFVESLEKALPKVSPGDQILSDLEMNGLLIPFYDLIQYCDDIRVVRRVIDEVFIKLLNSKFDEEYEFDAEEIESELERHNFMLSATRKYFPYFDGIEEALLSIATNANTTERTRSKVFELHERYQKARVPIKRKEITKVNYKPLTSEEAKMQRKKQKKKRKRPATMKPPKKRVKLGK